MTDDLGVPEAQTIAASDQWLQTNLGVHQLGDVTAYSCSHSTRTSALTNHIAMLVIGDGVAAELNYQQLNDYTLLAAIEDL